MTKVTTKRLAMQKRLAARCLGVSVNRIRINYAALENLGMTPAEFKESITKADMRKYLKNGLLTVIAKQGVSRGRARFRHQQKKKGRHRGMGSKKGTRSARYDTKLLWMSQIRSQRELLKSLRESNVITQDIFKQLYRKASGGFFRSRRHIRLYLEEHELMSKQTAQKPTTP